MILQKWNYQTHDYEPYPVPDHYLIVLYSPDLDLNINCTGCFKLVTYGETFTSKTIHTEMGLGFPVCEDCYSIELEDEQKSRAEI